MRSGTNAKRHNSKLKQLIFEILKGNQNVSQMNIWAENEFFQSGNSYWMHFLTIIVNNNGRYCLMSVLSLYFYCCYIIDDFTKKNEFFLPKSDRLIHLLISIVNNKCTYPWLCFPLVEASFSQRKLMIRQKKRNFIYRAAPVHWILSDRSVKSYRGHRRGQRQRRQRQQTDRHRRKTCILTESLKKSIFT